MNKLAIFIVMALLIGILYRLIITSNDNFIFNMDNARDMVDVREMVVLHKMRLIGPTSAIEGFYNGPAWYYLLSIPFILSNGNPYASILLEIILWAIGGYYLLLLVNKYYSKLALLAISLIWIASNFIILGIQYAFNPNPVIFLTPVFIFYLIKYLESNDLKSSLITGFLAGIFFHFEIAASIFLPIVIIANIFLCKKQKYIRTKAFVVGVAAFLVTFLPQLLFDLRNNFQLTRSLIAYKSGVHGDVVLDPLLRIGQIMHGFYDTLLPTLMNFQLFTNIILVLFIICVGLLVIRKQKLDLLTQVCISMLATFILVNIPLKVDLMRWHYNAVLIAAVILIGFTVNYLTKINLIGKILAVSLITSLTVFSVMNMGSYLKAAEVGDLGNSIVKNELAAIDYTYQESVGKNFKVYIYLPSVIDYPYQYLYWWRGLQKYGYLPEDYAYLPSMPDYIKQKARFDTGHRPESSGLTFLIKEPEDGRRHLWENSFKSLDLLKTATFGAITVEIRK